MCMEDVRLARKTYTIVSNVVVPAGTTVDLVPEQKNRISMLIAPVAAGTGFIRFQAVNNTAGTGIPIAGMQWPLILHLQHDADLVCQGLTGQAVGGDLTVYIAQTFLEDQ